MATRHGKQADQELLLHLIRGTMHPLEELPGLLRGLYARETLQLNEWVGYPGLDHDPPPYNTALIWSLRTNFTWPQQCMRLLMGLGASSTQRNREGRNPLEYFASQADKPTMTEERLVVCAKMLIDAGGLESFTLHPDGKTALHLAAQKKNTNNTTLCQLMIAHGGEEKTTEKLAVVCARVGGDGWASTGAGVHLMFGAPLGNTALHFAAIIGCMELCKLLLDNGADANATNANQDTVLHEAVRGGNLEVCRMLLEKGAVVLAEEIPSGFLLEDMALRFSH